MKLSKMMVRFHYKHTTAINNLSNVLCQATGNSQQIRSIAQDIILFVKEYDGEEQVV